MENNMTTTMMTPRFEIIKDVVLDNTSESQALVKDVIVHALGILVSDYEGVDAHEQYVAVAKKLLEDVNK
jgi:hypothetical protein